MGEALVDSVAQTLTSLCLADPELARICQQVKVDASSWEALMASTLVLGSEYHATQAVRAAQLRVVDAHPSATLRAWAAALWRVRRAKRNSAHSDVESLRFGEALAGMLCDAQLKVLLAVGPA